MPYQPGPFGQATAADIHIAPGVYDFTDDAAGLQGELGAIAAGWDGTISDLEAMAMEPWDVELNADLFGMVEALDVVSGSIPAPYMDAVINTFSDTQLLLDAATSFAPLQAWSDPGEAFVPPDTALVIVPPTVDPDAFTQAPNEIVGATTEGRNPALGLFNVTAYGSKNFAAGDDFEIVALGPAGAEVVVDSSLNGETLPSNDIGQIDGNGQLFLRGTLGPEAVGVWKQKWYINGELMASFNFVVAG